MNADALFAIITLFALACLFFGPWQWVCTDVARQIIFEKRDAVFDMAAAGELDFRSDEYRAIRRSLESSIRFAHEFSLVRFIWSASVVGGRGRKQESSLQGAVASIRSDVTREKVEKLVFEAQTAVLLMILAKSPIFVVASILLLVPLLLFRQAHVAVRTCAVALGEVAQLEAENTPSDGARA